MTPRNSKLINIVDGHKKDLRRSSSFTVGDIFVLEGRNVQNEKVAKN